MGFYNRRRQVCAFYIDNQDDTYCLKVWNVEKEKWESYDGQTELLVLDARDKRNSMSIGAEKNFAGNLYSGWNDSCI